MRIPVEPSTNGSVPLPVCAHSSRRRARVIAHAPRVLLWCTVGLLVLAGARAALLGAARPTPVVAHTETQPDLAAEGLAAEFARRYLTYDATRPAQDESALNALGAAVPTPLPAATGRRVVLWTRAVQDQQAIAGGRLITVAALTRPGGLLHLSVPVRRDAAGQLSVAGPPALIGGPLVDATAAPVARAAVADAQLRQVAARAVRNYLAGEADDLRADLTPDARVTLPALRLTVSGPADVTRAGPGGVLVSVQARDRRGATYPLRYELTVRRRDRWYVAAIQTYPDQP